MAHITFFEKPGCIGNRRQKEWLEIAGHTLEVVDLLSYPWEREELAGYFGGKRIAECFNASAPDVRDGVIDPSKLSDEEALELMLANPLLIKRPLMRINGHRLQGFDTVKLKTIISLEPVPGAEAIVESFKMLDMNTCPGLSTDKCTTTKEN